MLTVRETASALYGVSRVVRFDPESPRWFNASPEGFWNSFWVAAIALPVYAVQSVAHYTSSDIPDGPLAFAAVELLTYAIGWLLFPMVMISVATWMDRARHYFRYIVMYNWFQLVVAAALAPLVLLSASGLLTPPMTAPLFLLASAVFLVYGWYMAYRGLDLTGTAAAGVVFLDVMLAFVVNGTVQVMVSA